MRTLERKFKNITVKYIPKKEKVLTEQEIKQWLYDMLNTWTKIQ